MNALTLVRHYLSDRALDELVWELLNGRKIGYPPHETDLHTILREADAAQETDVILAALSGMQTLREGVERLVRRELDGSEWHETRIEYLRDES